MIHLWVALPYGQQEEFARKMTKIWGCDLWPKNTDIYWVLTADLKHWVWINSQWTIMTTIENNLKEQNSMTLGLSISFKKHQSPRHFGRNEVRTGLGAESCSPRIQFSCLEGKMNSVLRKSCLTALCSLASYFSWNVWGRWVWWSHVWVLLLRAHRSVHLTSQAIVEYRPV